MTLLTLIRIFHIGGNGIRGTTLDLLDRIREVDRMTNLRGPSILGGEIIGTRKRAITGIVDHDSLK